MLCPVVHIDLCKLLRFDDNQILGILFFRCPCEVEGTGDYGLFINYNNLVVGYGMG